MDSPKGCCEPYEKMDFSKLWLPDIDLSDTNLWYAVFWIVMAQVFKFSVLHVELRFRLLRNIFDSNSKAFCLYVCISSLLSVVRIHRFWLLLFNQPHWYQLHSNHVLFIAYVLLLFGSLLVLTGSRSQGVVRLYFGECFDIGQSSSTIDLSFPYTRISHPIYIGATMNFLSLALLKASPAGISLTIIVAFVYHLSIQQEHYLVDKIRETKKSNDKSTNTQD